MTLSFHLLFVAFAFSAAVIAHPGGHRGGEHGGPGGFPLPPFLQNVTAEGRQAFFAIITNQTLTIAQTESQINTWAQTYGVSDQVTAFETSIETKLNEIKANVTAVVNNLPSVQNQLQTIFDNKDQTRQQQADAIEALKTQYPQEVGVLFFLAIPKGPRGGPGGQGGFPGGQGGFPGGFGGNQGGFPGGNQGGFGGNQGGFPGGQGGFGGNQGGFGRNQGGRGGFRGF